MWGRLTPYFFAKSFWRTPTELRMAAMSDGLEQCCSCGHVHKTDFRIVKGKLQFRAVTDNRATAAVRRAFKFERD